MTTAERSEEPPPRIRVLLVDDDRIAVDLMASILEQEVDVTTCTSPTEALRTVTSRDYDVVCSDFSMPDMTGIELLGRINSHAPNAGCLLITGASQCAERQPGSGYHVLLKPFEPERLLRVVQQLGKVAQMRRSVGALREGAFRGVG